MLCKPVFKKTKIKNKNLYEASSKQEFGAQAQISCKEREQLSSNFGGSLQSTSCAAQRAKGKGVKTGLASEQLASALSSASVLMHHLKSIYC